MKEDGFEPKIIAFMCNWCTYGAADLAGVSRLQYPPNFRVIRVPCTGRINPKFLLSALRQGADGVWVSGCHPGDCHYQNGNYKTQRRIFLLRKLLSDFGIEPDRLRLEWISASEGAKFAQVVNEFIERVEELGPLKD